MGTSENACQLVLATSLAWFLIDLALLYYYNECGSEGCGRKRVDSKWPAVADDFQEKSPFIIGRSHSNHFDIKEASFSSPFTEDSMFPVLASDLKEFPESYPSDKLHLWEPPPVVPEVVGSPGEVGVGVNFPPTYDKLIAEQFKINKFNLLASDAISVNRSLPDVRLPECKTKQLNKHLPDTSVIIIFHNEAWSTLLRTVHSVINRSPRSLLKEIILVDDASERDFLGKPLEDYVAQLSPPVKVLRTEKRKGLIHARLMGAKEAKGTVLTFLDSHCECTEGWLEALLHEVASDRKSVVSPTIDTITFKEFQYRVASDGMWGGFNWRLEYKWDLVPQREVERRHEDRTLPLRTPAIAGGLLAIDKEYFYHLGAYDTGMETWGGENIEMSIRVWQCGGQLKIATCSHVGHVFRDESPYTYPGGVQKTIFHNYGRLATVWMDEWRDFFFQSRPGDPSFSIGDVSERLKLRKALRCRSFRWYLENIYRESPFPVEYHYVGEIRNAKSNSCLDTMGNAKTSWILGMMACHGQGANQVFVYTNKKQIMTDGSKCLTRMNGGVYVKFTSCDASDDDQVWEYSVENPRLKHVASGRCLSKPHGIYVNTPFLTTCNTRSRGQQWLMKGFKETENSVEANE